MQQSGQIPLTIRISEVIAGMIETCKSCLQQISDRAISHAPDRFEAGGFHAPLVGAAIVVAAQFNVRRRRSSSRSRSRPSPPPNSTTVQIANVAGVAAIGAVFFAIEAKGSARPALLAAIALFARSIIACAAFLTWMPSRHRRITN